MVTTLLWVSCFVQSFFGMSIGSCYYFVTQLYMRYSEGGIYQISLKH